MAIVDKQKVDLLYKKLFGVTKTDFGTLKGASNESVASPSLLRGDIIWTQAYRIPKNLAAPVTDVVELRTVECTADNTTTPISGVYPTWKTNYTNWIPPEFHPTYFVKVFIDNPGAANPASTGTQIFDAGSGGRGDWYFDYVSGVLNFGNYADNGDTTNVLPTGLTSAKSIFVVGYRYIGFVGITDQQEGKFGNLQLVDNTIQAINVDINELPVTGDVILKPRLDGFARVQSSRFSQNLPNTGDNPNFPTYEKTTLLARTSTTNGVEQELTLDGLSPGATNRFLLENNFTYKVSVEVTAKLDGGTDSAIWNLKFLAQRGANASTTSIIGEVTTEKVAGSAATAIIRNVVAAGSFNIGAIYKIKTKGNTDWASIALNNAIDFEVGTVFTATGVGSGTGDAYEYFTPQQIYNYSWSVRALADTAGVIKILAKGPTKINGGDPDKTIKWLAAINTLEIYQT